jgi:4-aminobutyrate aminotransferase-like enzyme
MTTRKALALLQTYESRNVTYVAPDGSWPIVWERAKGVYVWDPEGRRYLDLTAAFGVAAAGHANPRVVKAGREQMGRLTHAMGDVHPHALKARLARELSRLTFERWTAGNRRLSGTRHPRKPDSAKTVFCNSGFEAVEAALKTALMATGKPGVIAFSGAYHGLGYGALNATHREHFRSPFRSQLRQFGHFVPFPRLPPSADASPWSRRASRSRHASQAENSLEPLEGRVRRLFRAGRIGVILVEPIQVRGGVNVAPPGFLPLLRRLCDEHGALLILDEIYTGFGRTGKWFACEHAAVIPDIICLGKALAGGFPISACVGRAALMDRAWPPSAGEAIHTSTFLGNPVGCAMALAQIKEIERRGLVTQSARKGRALLALLAGLQAEVSAALAPRHHRPLRLEARGMGLLAGLELRTGGGKPATQVALDAVTAMLHRGFILLPEGEGANVISFTPPLTIEVRQLEAAVQVLGETLRAGLEAIT